MWWDTLIALGAGILAERLALLVALVLMRPKGALLAETVRLLPDLLRLLRRLAADSKLPRGVRARIVLLMVYLALPIDLIPDPAGRRLRRRRDHRRVRAASVVRRAGIEAVPLVAGHGQRCQRARAFHPRRAARIRAMRRAPPRHRLSEGRRESLAGGRCRSAAAGSSRRGGAPTGAPRRSGSSAPLSRPGRPAPHSTPRAW